MPVPMAEEERRSGSAWPSAVAGNSATEGWGPQRSGPIGAAPKSSSSMGGAPASKAGPTRLGRLGSAGNPAGTGAGAACPPCERGARGLALLASEELVARIRREREEARRAWQEVRAGVARNANHSNWPGGLITHPEDSLEIDVVPEVSAAARSGYPGWTPGGLQTHKRSRSSSLLGRPRLLNAF